MSWRTIPAILGKRQGFPGLEPVPTLMADLGTSMAPVGVSFSLLMWACSEDRGLVKLTCLPSWTHLFLINSCGALDYLILSKVVPCPLPSCFSGRGWGKGGKEVRNVEMVGQHDWLSGRESEQTLGRQWRTGKPGMRQSTGMQSQTRLNGWTTAASG